MDIDQARRKARALIAQATDAGVTVEEARSHALAAARLISKHELLAEVDGDEAGGSFIGAVTSPEVTEAIGAVLDVFSKVKTSGIGDSLKRAVSSSKRAVQKTRGGARRRRGR